MKILRNWWFVTIAVAVLVALLLAFGLPLVVTFMRPTWVRVTAVVLVLAIWALFAFLRRRKASKAAAVLAAGLAGPDAAGEEAKALSKRMTEALATLKTASGKRRDYLYARPWYVIIGPPGAGKTTALLNSGLRFPFEERALKGVGGTRNLDFWFADEAVLVDTAGRYTTQDSDHAVDSKGWEAFLGLLRKSRPLQPINGIIVAIGVDELIASDCARIDAHARSVRRRLVEMRRVLEVDAPVYVMLTKADLLAGFTQYFDDLDVEGRRAVLGTTLDQSQARPNGEVLARAFDEVTQAIADRQAKRLYDEVDPLRRGLLLGFPSQLGSLRARLMRFLDGALTSGDEPVGQLRGFYFTSGVQEGAPLDRILSGMAEVFDRPAEARGGAQGAGRAYFLNRLLTEVMLPEAGLVTSDPPARRRQRTRLAGAFAGVGALALVTLTLWGVSFARNRTFQGELVVSANAATVALKDAGADLRQVRDGDADLRALLPALDAWRSLPWGYDQRRDPGVPLAMRFGLFQSGLSAQSEARYREVLRRVLLPRLLLRLESVMQSAASDPMQLYEPLKVYLMLGQQGPMDAGGIKSWVTNDWAASVYPGADAQAERARLAVHLTALLEDPDLPSVWEKRRAPLDSALVAQSRAAIGTLSLADRAYALMRQKAAGAGPEWLVAEQLSTADVVAFNNPQAVLGARVPYFFTRAGYDKAYTLGLATVQQDLKRDLWVLGGDAATGGVREEMGSLRAGVAGRYARDYIAAWEAIVAGLEPGAYFRDVAAYGAMTKSPSPLKRVLSELRKNTVFTGGAQGVGKRMAQQQLNRSVLGRVSQDFNAGRATGLDAGAEITNYFAPLHDYVGDGKAPAPIDDFVAAIREAGKALIAARSMEGVAGGEANQSTMATAMAAVRVAAAGAPPQLQGFVAKAAGGGSIAQTEAATGAVAEAYAQSILPACREVTQDRYPFVRSAQLDVSAVDARRVFDMGAMMDAFVGQRLAPLMQKDGPVWRWNTANPVAAALDPGSPEQFAKAAQIRDLLSGGLPIRISVVRLGADVAEAEITSGGASYSFTAAGGQPRPLLWSIGGSVEATLVLRRAAAPGTPAPEIRRFEAQGPWALFRLLDQATTAANAGANMITASFGDGAAAVTLAIVLPSEVNPFSRAGLWSFRCPSVL